MGRNQIFVAAFDYLNQIGRVGDQRELSQKTGISQTSISRIFNNHVRQPSEDSLRKLNAAFGNIFNMRWLRGEVSSPMLVTEEGPFPSLLSKKAKNERFLRAIDYLYKIKKVDSQRDVAAKIGITESSLSRIKNGVKFVGDDTLRKMNESFDAIFNMAYFRVYDAPMLASDEEEQKFPAVLGEKEEEQKPEPMPAWASNFIDIFSKQVAEIENLRFELRQCLTEISDLKEQLKNQLKNQNN